VHKEIGLDTLRSLFLYNYETGDIHWRCRDKRKSNEVGRIAGTPKNDGYRRVLIKGKFVFSHQIAWALYYGEIPPKGMHLDHINGVKDDNRIVNLRLCTPAENRRNSKLPINSSTGYLGVYRSRGRFKALLKNRHLGMFDTPEEAHEAYKAAVEKAGWTTHRSLSSHAYEETLA
jgi:hypothetical protein